MTTVLLFDMESVIGGYLNAHSSVTALNAKVHSKLPTRFTTPWVRITQIDAQPEFGSPVEHLITYALQFDCYAGASEATAGRRQASELSRTIRAVLQDLKGQTVDEAVVTQVATTSHSRLPDETLDFRERFVLDVEVTAHAA
jgi:hypothetical protein